MNSQFHESIVAIQDLLKNSEVKNLRSNLRRDFNNVLNNDLNDDQKITREQIPEFLKEFIQKKSNTFDLVNVEQLEDLLIRDMLSIGLVDYFLESDDCSILNIDADSSLWYIKDDVQVYLPFGFSDNQSADLSLERICAEVGVRLNEHEPLIHRMWRGHVVMAILGKSGLRAPWIRVFKKSFFESWMNPNFPL